MTIHLAHTLWASVLVSCMPPWWCLPWTTTLQSCQSTLHWWSPLWTDQTLWRLAHPTLQSSLLKIMMVRVCVCACVCTWEYHGWVESFIYVCTHYERLSLNASTICMQWHICTYNMVCMYMYMPKVLYNFFTCSCSAEVWFTELHCHWGWFSQYHIGSRSSFWRLWL